jgi:hypothetical protein
VFGLWHRWRWKDRRRDLQEADVQKANSKLRFGVNDRFFNNLKGKTWHNFDASGKIFSKWIYCMCDSPLPWSARCALYIENGSGELNSESTCTTLVLTFGKRRFFLKETISCALLALVREMLSRREAVEDSYQHIRDFQRSCWLLRFMLYFFELSSVCFAL